MSAPQRRESSDFSIERILSKDGSTVSSSAVPCKTKETSLVSEQFLQQAVALRSPSKFIQNKLDWIKSFRNLDSAASNNQTEELHFQDDNISAEPKKQNIDSNSRLFNNEELSWLRCTRYHPPKLPRKSCNGKNVKRKPGSHPRIPFTKNQLEILEDKYKSNAYLTRKDVLHLSEILQLPQTRIKIWFQNRRARERRESQVFKPKEITIV